MLLGKLTPQCFSSKQTPLLIIHVLYGGMLPSSVPLCDTGLASLQLRSLAKLGSQLEDRCLDNRHVPLVPAKNDIIRPVIPKPSQRRHLRAT
jgi:hypothetical protein